MNCLLTISPCSPDQLLKDLFIAQYRYYSSPSSLFAKASSPAEANASSGSSSSLLSSIIVVMFVSFWAVFWLGKQITNYKTLPKAQRTRGLSSYHRISIKHQLQNLNQTSASRLNLKLKSLPNLASKYWPRFNFVTSSKHQRQKADQTSASKSCLNLNFKILTKVLKVWTKSKLYDQTSASKSVTNCCQHDPHH